MKSNTNPQFATLSSMAKAHWGILKMSLGNANHMGRFVQPSALLAFIHGD